MNCMISPDESFEPVPIAELPGVLTLKTKLSIRSMDAWNEELYRERSRKPLEVVNAQLVPYFAWGNRGSSEMSVWLSAK